MSGGVHEPPRVFQFSYSGSNNWRRERSVIRCIADERTGQIAEIQIRERAYLHSRRTLRIQPHGACFTLLRRWHAGGAGDGDCRKVRARF